MRGSTRAVSTARSCEHLQDLPRALSRVRELLTPGGLFFCDIVDFAEVCRSQGPPEVTAKLDHAFWLCQETAPPIFAWIGFEILVIDTTFSSEHVGFLLRPAPPTAKPRVDQAWLHALLRLFQELRTDWNELHLSQASHLKRL